MWDLGWGESMLSARCRLGWVVPGRVRWSLAGWGVPWHGRVSSGRTGWSLAGRGGPWHSKVSPGRAGGAAGLPAGDACASPPGAALLPAAP